MLSNPPYGKNWKTDLTILGGGTDDKSKKSVMDSRFVKSYKEQADFRMLPDVSDGQLLFLLNNIAKMKETALGSRILEVHNGSALFTGDAGSGASNARRYMIEEDLIEAIIQLPENIFYNTPITTHIWILSNRKEEKRKGKIQLIDASSIKTSLRKNLGKKNCELSEENRQFILDEYLNFQESEYSKIFNNEDFGYYKVTVERPLRQAILCNQTNLQQLEATLIAVGALEGNLDKAKLSNSGLKDTKAALSELKKTENIKAYLAVLQSFGQEELYLDFSTFVKNFNKALKAYNIKGANFAKALSIGMLDNIIVKDENAELQTDSKGNVIIDTNLTDTENIPMTYKGGINAFIAQEVLPYHPDAFVNKEKTQIGYEINFTKYFYKPKQLESVETIVARIKELEKQSDGMMASILEGLYE